MSELHPSGSNLTRRDFVKTTVATGLVMGAGAHSWSAESSAGGVPTRILGRTGEKVSAIGLGGYHIGEPRDEQLGIRIIRTAIDGGITFMDNCWDYHDGGSETRMGKALRDGYRQKVFLMTKIDGRTKQLASKQIEECLRRLQTDRIDLMQHHEMIRVEDADRIFASGGAMEAVLEAKKAGKIRYIGFTGHKDPFIHLRTLEVAKQNGFQFDAVQMPLNILDAHFRSFEKQVLPVLVREQIGVLGMKPLAAGGIVKNGIASAVECLHYALSLPTSVVITGIPNMQHLEQAFEAARTFKPMGQDRIAALLDRSRQAAMTGRHEGFKTRTDYDATTRHPEWIG